MKESAYNVNKAKFGPIGARSEAGNRYSCNF